MSVQLTGYSPARASSEVDVDTIQMETNPVYRGSFFKADTEPSESSSLDDVREPLKHWGIGNRVRNGRPFDEVDVLMLLCRNPCDKAPDISHCSCKVPCRFKDYENLRRYHAELGNSDDLAFPEDLLEIFKHISRNKKKKYEPIIRNSCLVEGHHDQQFSSEQFEKPGWIGTAMGCIMAPFYPKTSTRPPGPVNFFFKHGHYKNFVDAVMVDLKMIELLQVEEEIGSFQARYQLVLSWYDPSFDTAQWRNQKFQYARVTSYRAPRIKFLDVLEGSMGWEDHNNVAEVTIGNPIRAPGVVFKTINFTCSVRDDNPILWFPFDDQELTFEMQMPGSISRDDTDHGRYFIPLNCSVENKHDMLSWNYHKPRCHITKPRGLRSQMTCIFRISRRPTNHVINVMLVMGLLASLAGTAYMVPIQDVADRSAVTLTLLLTAVAFKQVLSQTLPRVAYLTYLDGYVLVCFLAIFIVALQNALSAFYVGVEGTASCGQDEIEAYGSERNDCYFMFGGELTLTPERSRFGAGGSLSLFKVLETEKKFQIVIGSLWIAFNLMYALIGFHIANRTVQRFDKELRVTSEDGKANRHRYNIDWDYHCENRKLNAPSFQEVLASPTLSRRCQCTACMSRLPRYENAGKLSILDQADEEDQNKSFDEKALECIVSEAGMALESSSLVPALLGAGLTVDRIRELDAEVVNETLREYNVGVQARLEILVAARDQVLLCFLLGASSYMMKALKLDGKMVTKSAVLRGIDRALESDRLKWNDFANYLYASVMLASSACPGVYILSQRTCRSQKGELYTQLFAGFGSAIGNRLPPGRSDNIVIIDIGSGQIKRFLCRVAHNSPLQLIYEQKDDIEETPSEVKHAEMYGEALQEMREILVAHYKSPDTMKDPPENSYKTPLTKIITAICGSLKSSLDENKDSFQVSKCYVLATASTRAYFSKHSTKEERLAKQAIRELITSALVKALGLPTEFLILSQAAEAEYEYRAVKDALQHAIDIPIDAQAIGRDSISALSWGKGSTQGFIRGMSEREDGTPKENPLTLQVGLNEIHRLIKDWIKSQGTKDVTLVPVGDKIKEIQFHNSSIKKKLRNEITAQIRQHLSKDLSQTLKFYMSLEEVFRAN